MHSPSNVVVIEDTGPRPATVRERLQELSGRRMGLRFWAIVDHIREIAVANGEYGDPEVYGIFKRLNAAQHSCELAEWHQKMAHEAMKRAVIR